MMWHRHTDFDFHIPVHVSSTLPSYSPGLPSLSLTHTPSLPLSPPDLMPMGHGASTPPPLAASYPPRLAKENRPRAVAASMAATLTRRVAEDNGVGEPEHALAAVEQLCRTEGSQDAMVVGARGGVATAAALVRACPGARRSTQHAH